MVKTESKHYIKIIPYKMKVLDYILLFGAIALLIASYYVYSYANAELGALVSVCATLCGAIFGARLGGRLYKKNHKNK